MKLAFILFCVLLYICLSNFSFCSSNAIENFQETGYVATVPQVRMVLYTSSRCPHCKDAKVEWNKLKDHIKDNCKYNRMVKLDQKEDKEIDDPSIEYVPTIKLYVKDGKQQEKVVTFDNHVKADLLEEFLVNNMVESNSTTDVTESFTGKYYADVDKGKMFNKFYTLCDNEHQQWNTS